jgi:hypothetical protein
MGVPDGNWTGGGRRTNGPPLVADVLRSVGETTVGTAEGDAGAYWRNSRTEGVRRTTVVTEEMFDDMARGTPEELGV